MSSTSGPDLERVTDLLDRLRPLSALAAAGGVAAVESRLRETIGVDEALVLARLVGDLGGSRRATAIFLRQWRRAPDHPDAVSRALWMVLERRGPLEAWLWMHEHPLPPGGSRRGEIRWRVAAASVLRSLHDHERADALELEAMELGDGAAWLVAVRARGIAMEDRREEALELLDSTERDADGQRGAEIEGARVTLLALLGRIPDALSTAYALAPRIESMWLWTMIADLHLERSEAAEAAAALAEARTFTPLAGDEPQIGIAVREVEAAHLAGDRQRAAEIAAAAIEPLPPRQRWPWLVRIAERMADPAHADAPRVVLPVPFVAQDRRTCSAASLASLAAAWAMPGDHREIAAEISFDGTPEPLERDWAERRGWRALDFDVDFASARTLIDRGVPFALVTRAADWAHTQVVMGYDASTETLVVREPNSPRFIEIALPDPFRPTDVDRDLRAGPESDAPSPSPSPSPSIDPPRGLALVPPHEAHRLDGLDLPGRTVRDRIHRIRLAMIRGEWAAAETETDTLLLDMPDEPMALLTAVDVAAERHDPVRAVALLDRLMASHPDDELVIGRRAALLTGLGRRGEAERLLTRAARLRGASARTLTQLATLLMDDPRRLHEATVLLRRAAQRAAHRAEIATLLATVQARLDRTELALELRRLAVLDAPGRPEWAGGWAYHAHAAGRSDAVLAELRRRAEHLGARHPAPWIALAHALVVIEQADEAIATLRKARERFPDDPELREVLLGRLAAKAHEAESPEAQLAAIDLMDEVAPDDPRNAAWRIDLLAMLGRRDEMEALLEPTRWGGRVPAPVTIARAQVAWGDGDGELAVSLADSVLAEDPDSAAALAMLGQVHESFGRHAEALAAADRAIAARPAEVEAHRLRFRSLVALDRTDDAIDEAATLLQLDERNVSWAMWLAITANGQSAARDRCVAALERANTTHPTPSITRALLMITAREPLDPDRKTAAEARIVTLVDEFLRRCETPSQAIDLAWMVIGDGLLDWTIAVEIHLGARLDGAPAAARALWAYLAIELHPVDTVLDRVDALPAQRPEEEALLLGALRRLAETGHVRALRRILTRHRERIDASHLLRCLVPFAFAVGFDDDRALDEVRRVEALAPVDRTHLAGAEAEDLAAADDRVALAAGLALARRRQIGDAFERLVHVAANGRVGGSAPCLISAVGAARLGRLDLAHQLLDEASWDDSETTRAILAAMRDAFTALGLAPDGALSLRERRRIARPLRRAADRAGYNSEERHLEAALLELELLVTEHHRGPLRTILLAGVRRRRRTAGRVGWLDRWSLSMSHRTFDSTRWRWWARQRRFRTRD